MKCRKLTHRYHSLRHVRSVENPSLPGPLPFFSQNGGSHSLLRLGEGPATKERSGALRVSKLFETRDTRFC